MSRVIKPKDKDHAFVMTCDRRGKLHLVKGGRDHAYLWVGGDDDVVYTFSGQAALIALAKAILEEVK